ncbi:MAG: aquaporin [Nitrospira sp.]|nr:aquaporin [Nitrospira sp.]
MEKNWRPVIAEGIGTFIFCVIGAGAIVTDELTKGGLGLMGIALAHGLALSVVVSAIGHISGGHVNPAVTIGLWMGQQIDTYLAGLYIMAQLIGAVCAGFLLRAIFVQDIWQPVHLGTPGLAPGVSVFTGILVETVLTFFLVIAVYGTAVDPKAPKIGGFGIGLTVLFDILLGGPITGASMNPARTFGPAIASGFWENHIVYWIGPILGAIIAGVLYSNFFLAKTRK